MGPIQYYVMYFEKRLWWEIITIHKLEKLIMRKKSVSNMYLFSYIL